MEADTDFVYGIFKAEHKNRFLCSVMINGLETICYIPSSCRISNFLKMSKRIVMLKPTHSKNCRTGYALFAVKYGRAFIMLNFSKSNETVEKQLNRRLFAFLGQRKRVSHEFRIGAYKSDIFIHDSNTLVEIKSILSFDNTAKFPSVESERAIKQLKNILSLLKEGYKAAYIFVSLSPEVKEIAINEKMKEFYSLFLECVSNGMQYKGVGLKLVNGVPNITKQIPVNIE